MKKIAVFLALMLTVVTNCYAQKEVSGKNYVEFDIDMTYSNLTIDVYNNDTNKFIEKVILNKIGNIYYYNKGLNIKIVETTSDSAYEYMEDIILNNESKVIKFNRKVKNKNVTFKTIYRGYGKYIESVDSDTDINIYDEYFNEVGYCKSEGMCEKVLLAGKYFIKDNKTGRVACEFVTNNTLIYVSRYFIDGIYSEDELELDNVTRKGKLYYFNDPAYPEKHTILGEELDFSDSSNYYYIFGEGIFYKYSKKDEVIDIPKKDDATSDKVNDTNISDNTSSDTKKDDITSDKVNDTNISGNTSGNTKKDDILDEEICINVPDTQTNSNDIIYFKKKYYF